VCGKKVLEGMGGGGGAFAAQGRPDSKVAADGDGGRGLAEKLCLRRLRGCLVVEGWVRKGCICSALLGGMFVYSLRVYSCERSGGECCVSGCNVPEEG